MMNSEYDTDDQVRGEVRGEGGEKAATRKRGTDEDERQRQLAVFRGRVLCCC